MGGSQLSMRSIRQEIGGLGNLMFKQAFLWALMREGQIPDLYVQGEMYWKKYANEVKQMFSAGIGSDTRVALHIRRGDYLKVSQFHVNLWDTGYYQEAVKLFPPDTKFLVFCKDSQGEAQDKDDQEWCRRNIPLLGIDFEMYEHTVSETDDLNAMAACKGIIGANSSFSWWAAYLNPHKDATVVFPKQWFVDGVQRTELLPHWTLI
jgi:hypothetical protein